MLAFAETMREGHVNFDRRIVAYWFVAAATGLIAHVLIFKYAKPKTLAKAIMNGVFLAFGALLLCFFSLLLVGWMAAGLGLKAIAELCGIQVMMMVEGMPFLLMLTLVGGSIAGTARRESLARSTNVR